jgi:hypothetical protein
VAHIVEHCELCVGNSSGYDLSVGWRKYRILAIMNHGSRSVAARQKRTAIRCRSAKREKVIVGLCNVTGTVFARRGTADMASLNIGMP